MTRRSGGSQPEYLCHAFPPLDSGFLAAQSENAFYFTCSVQYEVLEENMGCGR